MNSFAPSPTILKLLWHKLRTSDDDGALKAICTLQQQMRDSGNDKSSDSAWVNECSSDGSALLHTVGWCCTSHASTASFDAAVPLACPPPPPSGCAIQCACGCISAAGLQCLLALARAGMAQTFLQAGANPNRSNKNGMQPLHIAAAHGNHDAARLLLEVLTEHCMQWALVQGALQYQPSYTSTGGRLFMWMQALNVATYTLRSAEWARVGSAIATATRSSSRCSEQGS